MNTEVKEAGWKVIKSEYLHREPWLTVRRECVELPNGNRIPSYYILEYPDWVNIIAITKEKQFVFVKQYRHGIKETRFELCAGVCEKEDATPLISAQRELLEETGYGNGIWEEYMHISPNASTHTNLTHCFLAKDVEKIGEQKLEESEDLSVHLLSIDEVKALLFADEIRQALMVAPLWKYLSEQAIVFPIMEKITP
ncbi:MAG: NUDIX hydrolase [Tannerellaceae bacterium]|jgi:ADP-ribose pyrophosphatase|nr:NUDIX hydrolase [Tannerellaceae bacterium]